jgi:hypothetical protein
MRAEKFSVSANVTRVTPPKGFNLSRWAIDHGGFTAFLLLLLLAAGAFSFLRIGQKEDPDFTFRVMVVQVLWPGATVGEMQDQVVDKSASCRRRRALTSSAPIRGPVSPTFSSI